MHHFAEAEVAAALTDRRRHYNAGVRREPGERAGGVYDGRCQARVVAGAGMADDTKHPETIGPGVDPRRG